MVVQQHNNLVGKVATEEVNISLTTIIMTTTTNLQHIKVVVGDITDHLKTTDMVKLITIKTNTTIRIWMISNTMVHLIDVIKVLPKAHQATSATTEEVRDLNLTTLSSHLITDRTHHNHANVVLTLKKG